VIAELAKRYELVDAELDEETLRAAAQMMRGRSASEAEERLV
jgi:hypothetical protein